MSDPIRLAIHDGLARITIARPPLNVLTTAMLDALAGAIDRAAATDGVRLVRLDAEGKVFSAGVDVADHTDDKVAGMMEALARLFDAFERVGAPTVSVVHGAALGGGCEVALGTDLCVASGAASFGQPEIRLALFAPPASVLLPRLVGERRALGLLLTGEAIPAAEAERIGLVNRVFPAERFDADVEAWLGTLLGMSGAALRLAKRAVRESRDRPAADARRALDRLYLDDLMRTADAREGLAAFLEKRRAVWRHR
jgi:cyclohexa-1,5-dienecarbonyl-CoA hydratase